MTFGEKLKKARNEAGLKQSELAKQLNTTANTISNWENNVSKPDLDALSYICGILHVRASYFLQPIIPEDEVSITELNLIKKYRSLDSTGKEHVNTVLQWESDRMSQMQTPESSSRRRVFAYYGKIAAAGINYGFEDIISETKEYLETDENRNADYTIGISGNSMEPTYYDGDIVYVAKTYHLDVGDIGIFQKDNGIYIKEVGEGGLISHNTDYEILTGDDVKCLGKVIGIAERG